MATSNIKTTKSKSSNNAKPTINLDKRLVLNQWLLSLFGVTRLEVLPDTLRAPEAEGYTDDNTTRFVDLLAGLPSRHALLSRDTLRTYDENIVRHWKAIAEHRERAGSATLSLKYFQYLGLLFTEIYLDRFFSDADGLRNTLNAQVATFNAEQSEPNQVNHYDADDLRKIAFWQATGSGKTLIMHVNILQYQHYLAKHGRTHELNRIILLTPNEGLSRQHRDEFDRSGMDSELFRKDGGRLFTSQSIEIIDINKLADESKDKTVAVDAFEGNNLVLVDEGHRGSGGEDWMLKRRTLSEQGFSFEYSATFGQAMKAAGKPNLTREYAKCILFDYSYKYFYRDGYGKDYAIYNLKDDAQEDVRQSYLTGGLLTFYQQLRLAHDKSADFQPYLLEKPLLVFVGGSVTKNTSRRDVSDVVDILLFLATITNPHNAAQVTQRIGQLINGRSGLLADGRDLFANAFAYLHTQQLTPEQIYADLLLRVFGASGPALLHLENIKSADGEIALKVGSNDPFGVINIGDAAGLIAICRDHSSLVVDEPEFSGSLFQRINAPNSPITVLIGSKKFTEGWNSWRVSTMGLMSIGQSEGSQIIQLFGRGVRLKGYQFGLKRSRQVQIEQRIPSPKGITTLETLNIFGVRADYMEEFRKYLADEGLPPNTSRELITLPTIKLFGQNLPRLRVIAVKDGIDFKRQGPRPTFAPITADQRPASISIDWYPKIESQRSAGADPGGDTITKDEKKLEPKHLAFFDYDAIFFELLRFKNEKAWHNLNITREGIRDLLAQPDWYKLTIPADALAFTGMDRIRSWQEIAIALLKKYCEAFYKYQKSAYELPHLEYRDLDPLTDSNMIDAYDFQVEASEEELIAKLRQLETEISAGNLTPVEVRTNNFKAMVFERHLYKPLIYLDSKLVAVKPVALNAGERDFIEDLCSFYANNTSFFAGKELYLLRNQSRTGIGFFEAGNFYPDFILWLLHAGKQYVTFLDPKGIRNLRGVEDPKIAFAHTIKRLEKQLRKQQQPDEDEVILNSFIIANTAYNEVAHWKSDNGRPLSIANFITHNVYFQQEARTTYIRDILQSIISSPTQTG